MIFLIIFSVLFALFVVCVLPRLTPPNVGSLTFVNGAVKSGKTTVSLYLAKRDYKSRLFKWKVACFFLPKSKRPEKPIFYSNIPIKGVSYSLLTSDLLRRKTRFAYKSVIYLDEASLVAYKDIWRIPNMEMALSLFAKLIAHETRGGAMYFNSQAMGDISVAFRRCVNSYIYVHRLIKWIPFILVACVREERYSEDNVAMVQNYDRDIEDPTKYLIIPKHEWKTFDCYCLSKLTDDLPVSNAIEPTPTDLRTDYIINLKETK